MKNVSLIRINIIVFVLCILLFQSGLVLAQQNNVSDCLNTIKDALTDREFSLETEEQKKYAHQWLSSQQYQDKTTSEGALLDVLWDELDLVGSYNRENFQSFRSNFSQGSLHFDETNRQMFIFKVMAGSNAPELLKICMGSPDVDLNANIVKNGNQFTLEIVYKNTDNLNTCEVEFDDRINLKKIKRFKKPLKANTVYEVRLTKNEMESWSTVILIATDNNNREFQKVIEVPPFFSVDPELDAIYTYFAPIKKLGWKKKAYRTRDNRYPASHQIFTPTNFNVNKSAIHIDFDVHVSYDRFWSPSNPGKDKPGPDESVHGIYNASYSATLNIQTISNNAGGISRIVRLVNPEAHSAGHPSVDLKFLKDYYKTKDRMPLSSHPKNYEDFQYR